MFDFQERNANNFIRRENSHYLSYGKPSLPHEQHPQFRNKYPFEPRFKNSLHQSPNHGPQKYQTRGVNFLFQNPRSFQELHIERNYLIDNLQFEDAKATELLKQIANLQECIRQGQEPKARNSCRKTIRWLMGRMSGINRQEQWILQRLGQVTQEIQNRERLSRIEAECNKHQFCNGLERLQLDPNTPEFTPYWYDFQKQSVDVGPLGYHKEVSHELAAPVRFAENGDSEGQMEAPFVIFGKGRSSSLVEGDKNPVENRRLSMPGLSTRCAEEEPEAGPLYLGYYMSN